MNWIVVKYVLKLQLCTLQPVLEDIIPCVNHSENFRGGHLIFKEAEDLKVLQHSLLPWAPGG